MAKRKTDLSKLPEEQQDLISKGLLKSLETGQVAQDIKIEPPRKIWQIVLTLIGIPVEKDAPTAGNLPIFAVLFHLQIVIVSINAFYDPLFSYETLGLIPDQVGRYGGLNLLTSFFVHGGWWHLIVNMYFLHVFGTRIASNIGVGRYLLALLFCSVIGSLCHILMTTRPDLPAVGASGGIAGILVLYAVKEGGRKLGLFLVYRWFWIPAWVYILGWFTIETVQMFMELDGDGVSRMAHIGGGVGGLILLMIYKKKKPPTLNKTSVAPHTRRTRKP